MTYPESIPLSNISGLVAILKILKLDKAKFILEFYLEIALENLSDGAEALRLNSLIWLPPAKLSLLIFFFLPILKI